MMRRDLSQYIAILHELAVGVTRVDRRRVFAMLLQSLARREERTVDERSHREHTTDDRTGARCRDRSAGRTETLSESAIVRTK